MVKITVDVINPRSDSIYCVLKRKLGREPKHSELTAEVGRILQESHDERQQRLAAAGRLPHQR